MELQHIARIEQLRYELSSCTRAALRAKGPERAAYEAKISGIKEELENLLSLCPGYVLIGKAHIEGLRTAFLALPKEERARAIAGVGHGAALLDGIEKIFRRNAQLCQTIANLICALDVLIGQKESIGAVLEGAAQFCVAELGGPRESIERFVSAARELGFGCNYINGKLFLSARPSFAALSDSPTTEQPQRQQLQRFELALSREIGGKKILISAALAAAAQQAEEKARKILAHPNVKRWILGVFKNNTEREKYAKVQRVLTQLAAVRKGPKEIMTGAGAIFASNIAEHIFTPPIEVEAGREHKCTIRAAPPKQIQQEQQDEVYSAWKQTQAQVRAQTQAQAQAMKLAFAGSKVDKVQNLSIQFLVL